MFLLPPLNETAFVVLVSLHDRLNVPKAWKNPVEQKTTALLVPFININGTDKSLKRIAIYIIIMLMRNSARVYILVETNLKSEFIQPFTAYQITAGLGEEPLALATEIRVEIIGRY
jgi:hypothetical protein